MRNHMKHMGNTIRKAREAKKITQMELAEEIQVSPRTIVDIENGKRNTTVSTLNKLIHALDIALDEIIL